jgi:hypothetical protein
MCHGRRLVLYLARVNDAGPRRFPGLRKVRRTTYLNAFPKAEVELFSVSTRVQAMPLVVAELISTPVCRKNDRKFAKIQPYEAAELSQARYADGVETPALISLMGAWPRSVVSPGYGRGRLPFPIERSPVAIEAIARYTGWAVGVPPVP